MPVRWTRRVLCLCAAALLLAASAGVTSAAKRHAHPKPHARPHTPVLPREGPAPSFDLPLATAPLDTPLVVTGGFGEYRIGHFHAGFDFGTGGVTGKKVYAPLSGHIERIRTSGVGYGRSLYLRSTDGRTIQFGHLDAFVEPIASWVRAIQDSSGQYEQDLWPAASRFPIRVGQQIAWTGQSGAGGPHMHFEIRRGDMAYMPMRAGLRVKDDSPPSLVSLTLEPLDDTSYVERGAAPYTIALGGRAETLSVIGRVRAIVGSRDGVWKGVDRMQPWLTRMDWDGQFVEARFDSISWATDMVESDYVYDAGRVIGEKGIVLWAPAGWRPRVIQTSAPLASEAGTIVIHAGDAPKTLVLAARDAAGNRTEARVVLRAPRPGMGGPDPRREFARHAKRTGDDRFEFFALPGPFLRVTYRGLAAGVRDVRIRLGGTERPASANSGGWSAVLPAPMAHGLGPDSLVVHGEGPGGPTSDVPYLLFVTGAAELEDFTEGAANWFISQDARFDRCVVVARDWEGRLPDSGELHAGSKGFYLGPESEPLRGSARIMLGRSGEHSGVCRLGADGWEWLGGKPSKDGLGFDAESHHLGYFALFSDTLPPRIGAPVSAGVKGGPYPRWAIEASLVENGSGVDARASWIECDGVRRPSEWDPEAGVLRWRPAVRPNAGTHHLVVVATDKAGNVRRRAADLVLD